MHAALAYSLFSIHAGSHVAIIDPALLSRIGAPVMPVNEANRVVDDLLGSLLISIDKGCLCLAVSNQGLIARVEGYKRGYIMSDLKIKHGKSIR